MRLQERTSATPAHRRQQGQPCHVKLRYRTHERAIKAVVHRFNEGWPFQWVYECPWCAGWHGTCHSEKHAPRLELHAGVIPVLTLRGHDDAG